MWRFQVLEEVRKKQCSESGGGTEAKLFFFLPQILCDKLAPLALVLDPVPHSQLSVERVLMTGKVRVRAENLAALGANELQKTLDKTAGLLNNDVFVLYLNETRSWDLRVCRGRLADAVKRLDVAGQVLPGAAAAAATPNLNATNGALQKEKESQSYRKETCMWRLQPFPQKGVKFGSGLT